jgi:hypothetical protein
MAKQHIIKDKAMSKAPLEQQIRKRKWKKTQKRSDAKRTIQA